MANEYTTPTGWLLPNFDEMAQSPPLLILPGQTPLQPQVQKDASKFDIIAAYKHCVHDPDVNDNHCDLTLPLISKIRPDIDVCSGYAVAF
jgi:hypothetical protein